MTLPRTVVAEVPGPTVTPTLSLTSAAMPKALRPM
jgi:hypothetical protein